MPGLTAQRERERGAGMSGQPWTAISEEPSLSLLSNCPKHRKFFSGPVHPRHQNQEASQQMTPFINPRKDPSLSPPPDRLVHVPGWLVYVWLADSWLWLDGSTPCLCGVIAVLLRCWRGTSKCLLWFGVWRVHSGKCMILVHRTIFLVFLDLDSNFLQFWSTKFVSSSST